MKKLFVLFAAVALVGAFTATSMAQDWDFYGSSRLTTFYNSYDKDSSPTGESDSNIDWAQQGNSRIGAKVGGDVISGRFEYGTGVNLRLLFGEWNFGAGKLLIGQDYTPISIFYSSQAWGQDYGLSGLGGPYGGRRGQMKLKAAGVEVALIENSKNDGLGANQVTTPKLEASYNGKFGPAAVTVMGGYQSYKDLASDESLNSTIYGAGVSMGFGPATVSASVHAGTNFNNAGWAGGGSATGVPGGDDAKHLGVQAAVGFSASEAARIEAGFGYLANEMDTSGAETDTQSTYYVQLNYTVAPGFYIVPEIGMIDYMDDANGDDEGSMTYVGAKWQINF